MTYTWKAVKVPGGSLTVFSANRTNTVKSTTVTFNRAGTYQFLVTITDTGRLSTTSKVTVLVKQTMSHIKVAPPTAKVRLGAARQFTFSALGQFDRALTV